MNGDYQILAFCCQYCAYAAADLAGGLRLQYPPQVKIIQIPCTGKMDVLYALQAFEEGADAVMVAGCLPGDCHFLEGNYNAVRRVERVKHILQAIGLQPERIKMFHISSSMASRFVSAVEEMCSIVKELGPNPLRIDPKVVSEEKGDESE
ncbi:MAG: hydrogenase iron-sulfur subunit [Anaerolineales bacterium]|nr:hydrogenase iron-sulfur subunit [Anaerolineales bacterium]MCS7248227.1 hydrogenase iron-sulfur subunit [Anaerolineales bacterium]MDW8162040.1 hydrogenase iron-sulfur subunit [Anaerolineales bacterium]MDW8445665.1 hydrogenase iron-sulfur subunit [Anaerolineales bacterium]